MFPRILEVEAALAGRTNVIEVRPEVSFDELAAGERLDRKKSWTGLAQRRALLEQAGIVIPIDLGEAGTAPADDVLDATVAA